jgi:hypothetical protein
MIPTFLCIGGQRCGTTWLHSVLDRLPNVHVCPSKETDFFYGNMVRQDVAAYERNFDPPSDRAPCAVRGELSPNYCMLKRPAIELIRKLYPHLRLVLVIREPVERTLSQAWLDLRYMNGQCRTAPLSLGEYLRHVERQRTKRRNDYARVIRDWRAVFGAEALHVELYDDLCADPAAFLRRVLRHVGADDCGPLPEPLLRQRVFESGKAHVPPMVRWYLAQDYSEAVRRLNDLLAGRVTKWLTAIDQTMAEAPLTWRMLRSVNKWVLSVPEKIAYAGYDSWRDLRLASRSREILLARPPVPRQPPPPAKVRNTGLHRDAATLPTR